MVYLHIGTGKTGTTSIQDFLRINSTELIKNDIMYFSPNLGQLNLDNFLQSEVHKTSTLSEVCKLMNKKAINENCNNIIWSCETLWLLNQENIKLLKTLFKDSVRIIIYLRRQDKFLESAYKQWCLKHKINHYTSSLPSITDYFNNTTDYLNNTKVKENLYYHKTIDKWAEVFGKDNIMIQPFEKNQMPNGLISSFLKFLDTDLSTISIEERNKNQSWPLEFYSITALMNLEHEVPYICRPVVNLLNRINTNGKVNFTSSKYTLISKKLRKKIQKKYRKSNKYIAQYFMNRNDLFLDLEYSDIYAPPMKMPNKYKEIVHIMNTAVKLGNKDYQEEIVNSLAKISYIV